MQFVIASHNKHKIEEFRRILEPLDIELIEAQLSEVEENGETFIENAYVKAKSACLETGLPSIADDSGLCIDALGGEPGVRTARYAPEGQRKKTVLMKMKDVPDDKRTAYFVAAIACVFPNGDVIEVEGKCYGKIGYECKGEGGFGYDPIFMYGKHSFSEMSPEEKDAVSHRGVALRILEDRLKEYLRK